MKYNTRSAAVSSVDRAFHRAMVSLLGFADIIGTERAALAQLRRARGVLDPPPRQDNRNVTEESHFFLYN
jgi:hypothetical protein